MQMAGWHIVIVPLAGTIIMQDQRIPSGSRLLYIGLLVYLIVSSPWTRGHFSTLYSAHCTLYSAKKSNISRATKTSFNIRVTHFVY